MGSERIRQGSRGGAPVPARSRRTTTGGCPYTIHASKVKVAYKKE